MQDFVLINFVDCLNEKGLTIKSNDVRIMINSNALYDI